MKFFGSAWLLCVVLTASAAAADPVAEAKQLFATFVQRLNAFDPAVADLYADEAKIENTRRYPDGSKQTAVVPAPKYKAILRDAMPAARQRGDTSDFLAVEYTPVGAKVRISTTRFSNAKLEATPLVLVVGPGPGGTWTILEELSESRPERKE